MKYLQSNPWKWIVDYNIDIKGDDHAIVAYLTCPTLSTLENEGTGCERVLCLDLERETFTTMAHYFNPSISVTPLKVPPRMDYSDFCCHWEFKLEGNSTLTTAALGRASD